MKYFLILLLMVIAAPLQAQFGTALIIDGNRYIVHTSRINGTVTVESWPMPSMQQRNYNHARKYSAPVRTYAAPTPTRTYRPSVRPLEPSTPTSGQCLVWDSRRHRACKP